MYHYTWYTGICSMCDVVSSYIINIEYNLSHKCFELSACDWLWSFASLALMLSRSVRLTPRPIQKTLLEHVCFVSVAEGRETGTGQSVAAARSVFTYYLISFPD